MSDTSSKPRTAMPKPWTIKGVPKAARAAAVTAAKAEGRHMGAWIEAAILHHLEIQTGASAFPGHDEHACSTALAGSAEKCAEAAGALGLASMDSGATSAAGPREGPTPKVTVVVIYG